MNKIDGLIHVSEDPSALLLHRMRGAVHLMLEFVDSGYFVIKVAGVVFY